MSHASIPAEVRAARGLPDSLVRISVGIEDPEDLIKGEPHAISQERNAMIDSFQYYLSSQIHHFLWEHACWQSMDCLIQS